MNSLIDINVDLTGGQSIVLRVDINNLEEVKKALSTPGNVVEGTNNTYVITSQVVSFQVTQ
jgi:hypothetical protein